MENLKQYVHYEKYNKVNQARVMWKLSSILMGILLCINFYVIEKMSQKILNMEYAYQTGMEVIKNTPKFNFEKYFLEKHKQDSLRFNYLKTKRTGRN